MQKKVKAPCTVFLIAVNILMFLLVELTGFSEDTGHMLHWGAAYGPLISKGEYYRLFTCMFLHFGIAHLANNMLVLYVIGDNLEAAVGKIRYFLIYFLGGVGGNLLSYLEDRNAPNPPVSAGASGGVFAIVGAMIYVLLVNKGRLEDLTICQMVIMAAFSLYLGYTSQGVDNTAHVGGLICGFLLAVLLYRRKRETHGEGASLS